MSIAYKTSSKRLKRKGKGPVQPTPIEVSSDNEEIYATNLTIYDSEGQNLPYLSRRMTM